MRSLRQLEGIGGPEDPPSAVWNFFEGGSILETQRVEPGLLLHVEGECERVIVQLKAGVMVGQWLGVGVHFQLRGAVGVMPVFVVLHRSGDQQIAAFVRVLQQGMPRFLS